MVSFPAEMNQDEDSDNIGLGCALEHFSEIEEVINMIDNVQNIYNTSTYEVEYERLYNILKQYYEQPHLLDPHLDKILAKFLSLIKNKDSPDELKHATFNYMYQIIRVRGYKVVVRHLPHEVSDLLTILKFLEAQDINDKETWRSRFVLLLWLSIVVIIPFHMSRLDGFAPSQEGTVTDKKLTVMERIFNICKLYSMSKDSCAEASAFLASKFLVRSDVKEQYMTAFFDWACELHSDLQDEEKIHYGVLAVVAAVLKHGKRDDLLPYADKLLEWVTKQNYKLHKAMLVRKYGVKIVQRIGLTFMRPRVATWRYQVGSRSLAANLSQTPPTSQAATPAAGDVETVDDADDDIPHQVEEVVELLLWSVRDEDSVVRWSAAKGLARLTARVPPAAAGEVADCVLALFQDNERDTTWHGGCMALAEMARRGLISSSRHSEMFSIICLALRRDAARAGGGARGARDAACHAAWAAARALPPHLLQPHAQNLAAALAATACFDREINCRRAASAAFQENVGRHGLFPHGIQVLTAADFQAVGPRLNAFLHVAPLVAANEEYTQPLIDHLLELKLQHWDCVIRELAAKSLNKLTPLLPEYVATTVLETLVKNSSRVDLNIRHGAILGIGEAILALSVTKLSNGGTGLELMSKSVWEEIGTLVSSLRSRHQFRGLGGELTRQACADCIANLSDAGGPYHATPVVDDWLNLLEDCLSHEVQSIRDRAINALPKVFNQYLKEDNMKYGDVTAKQRRMDLVKKYCDQLSNTGANGLLLRMGYSRAVGSLPKFVLTENKDIIVRSLIECTKVSESSHKWAESRRDSVCGLTDVCMTLGVESLETDVETIIEALLQCLDEYTVDMRGDVGAWVREASMAGLLSIIRECSAEGRLINSEIMQRVMSGIAQQAVEKIDRTRAHAGRIFTAFIYNDPPIESIPHREALMRIFPINEIEIRSQQKEGGIEDASSNAKGSESTNVVLWLFPGHTMPRFVQLLSFEEYRYSVVKGLVVSGGELTESLVKHTTQALFSYLNGLHDDDMDTLKKICDTVIKVFADNIGVKRITGPIYNFIDRLLSSGAVSPILEDPSSNFASDVLKYLQMELRGGKSIYKLLDSINVLCQLIQVGGLVFSKSLGQLVVYLCYGERYVRRCAATRLYEALTLYGDENVPQDNLQQVMTTLAETDWEKDVSELRPVRNELCDLMGIKRPVMKQKPLT